MAKFTIFYSHPDYAREESGYVTETSSAQLAGEDAAEALPGDIFPDEEPHADASEDEQRDYEMQLQLVRDELDIVVFAGDHSVKPERDPDWILT